MYDLMGHPGGERERSEATEQLIARRADRLFQVGCEDDLFHYLDWNCLSTRFEKDPDICTGKVGQ